MPPLKIHKRFEQTLNYGKMANEHMLRCSTSLVVKEMKVKITKYYCTSITMAKIKKDWPHQVLTMWSSMRKLILLVECILVQPFGKQAVSLKVIYTPTIHTKPCTWMFIATLFINSQKLGTTGKSNRFLDKQTTAQPHSNTTQQWKGVHIYQNL